MPAATRHLRPATNAATTYKPSTQLCEYNCRATASSQQTQGLFKADTPSRYIDTLKAGPAAPASTGVPGFCVSLRVFVDALQLCRTYWKTLNRLDKGAVWLCQSEIRRVDADRDARPPCASCPVGHCWLNQPGAHVDIHTHNGKSGFHEQCRIFPSVCCTTHLPEWRTQWVTLAEPLGKVGYNDTSGASGACFCTHGAEHPTLNCHLLVYHGMAAR
jgi:hypothetical protein